MSTDIIGDVNASVRFGFLFVWLCYFVAAVLTFCGALSGELIDYHVDNSTDAIVNVTNGLFKICHRVEVSGNASFDCRPFYWPDEVSGAHSGDRVRGVQFFAVMTLVGCVWSVVVFFTGCCIRKEYLYLKICIGSCAVCSLLSMLFIIMFHASLPYIYLTEHGEATTDIFYFVGAFVLTLAGPIFGLGCGLGVCGFCCVDHRVQQALPGWANEALSNWAWRQAKEGCRNPNCCWI